MVVAWRNRKLRVVVRMADNLESRQRVREHPYPRVCFESGDSGVDKYQLCTHNRAGFFVFDYIYIEGGAG